MTDTPTPGEVAYAAYWQCLSQHPALVTVPRLPWDALHEAEQAAWEAAWEALRDLVLRELVAGGAQAREERRHV